MARSLPREICVSPPSALPPCVTPSLTSQLVDLLSAHPITNTLLAAWWKMLGARAFWQGSVVAEPSTRLSTFATAHIKSMFRETASMYSEMIVHTQAKTPCNSSMRPSKQHHLALRITLLTSTHPKRKFGLPDKPLTDVPILGRARDSCFTATIRAKQRRSESSLQANRCRGPGH